MPNQPESPLPVDPVIEAYKKDVDRTLLRENLKLNPQQRLEKFERFIVQLAELRGAAKRPTQGVN